MRLHERMAELIRKDGRTQVQLAEASGVGQSTISAILTATRTDLRAEAVAKLGKALGVSPTAMGRLLYESVAENNS